MKLERQTNRSYILGFLWHASYRLAKEVEVSQCAIDKAYKEVFTKPLSAYKELNQEIESSDDLNFYFERVIQDRYNDVMARYSNNLLGTAEEIDTPVELPEFTKGVADAESYFSNEDKDDLKLAKELIENLDQIDIFQADLAERADVSVATIKSYRKDLDNLNVAKYTTVIKLANIYRELVAEIKVHLHPFKVHDDEGAERGWAIWKNGRVYLDNEFTNYPSGTELVLKDDGYTIDRKATLALESNKDLRGKPVKIAGMD